MPTSGEHAVELRERAIRFSRDLVEGPEELRVNAACKVGGQLGTNPDTLRNGVPRQRTDTGRCGR